MVKEYKHIGTGDQIMINSMIARRNVSETDEEIKRFMLTKLRKVSDPAAKEEALEYALSVHHENQKLFRDMRF